MSKIMLSISGDDPDEIRETLVAFSGGGGENLSVADLTARLKAALPSMDITMTPKAKSAEAEGEKKRGRPKKEAEPEAKPAEPEADPFGEKSADPEPQVSPAEVKKEAIDLLMAAYGDTKKQPKVAALLKEFGVKKFAEVSEDKANDLLAKAKAL